jgi:hypothetical protein
VHVQIIHLTCDFQGHSKVHIQLHETYVICNV